MEVTSGAGSFEVLLDSLVLEDGKIVLKGTVDEWNARAVVSSSEAVDLLRMFLSPKTLGQLAKAVPSEIRRARRAKRSED